MAKKTAVVLFNLGGPTSQEGVETFLFNLFSDPLIIRLPNPFRWLLAKVISKRRAPKVQKLYQKMGGGSLLLKNTEAQADALEKALGKGFKVFISMRCFSPYANETAKEIKTYQPDEIVFLPLYPQYSTTTTLSSFLDFKRALKKEKVGTPVREICCYPEDSGFIEQTVQDIQKVLEKTNPQEKTRLLFSAHGLPEKISVDGDPYKIQVEKSVKSVMAHFPGLESVVCYQSRVGPLKWIGPSTESEIERAAICKMSIVLVPISFVSEHLETLVELDEEYAELAKESGVPNFYRVPTASTGKYFIEGLKNLVLNQSKSKTICPKACAQCWQHRKEKA